MKRLPEPFDPADPNKAYGVELLRQVRPLEPSADRKRKVWMALQHSPATRPKIRARGVVIATLLLCAATGASATMTQLWKRWQAPPESVAATPTDVAAKPSAPPRPAPAPPSYALEIPPAPRVAPVAPKPQAPKSRAAVADSAERSAGAALMVRAMQARRASNFTRVRELSAEYRVKYPDGALFEEALALGIEAAVALDDDEAARLSAVYLQRYPRGRFRGQAQRAMAPSR